MKTSWGETKDVHSIAKQMEHSLSSRAIRWTSGNFLGLFFSLLSWAQLPEELPQQQLPFQNDIRVSSLNLWGKDPDGTRMKEIAKKIPRDHPPIFLLLQEVVVHENGSSTAHTLNSELKARGLNYNQVFSERKNKPGGQREGLAILSQLPFENNDIHVLQLKSHPLPSELKKGESWWYRMAIGIDVVHPEIGKIRVINCHLDSSESHSGARIRQIGEIKDWLAELDQRLPANSIFWGGDFNFDPSLPGYAGELKLIGSNSGTDFLNFNSTKPSWGKYRLDYIFVRSKHPDLKHRSESLEDLSKEKTPLSDHRFLTQHFVIGSEKTDRTRPVPDKH